MFQGFSASTFEWFTGLEQDNSREYFRATRERYEADVRTPFTLMLQELSGMFGGTVHVFRQQNDMRFAPADPYKTRTYGGLDFDAPAKPRLYADLSARGLYAGTGYHRLASDQLQRYRDAVVDEPTWCAIGGYAPRNAGCASRSSSATASRRYPVDTHAIIREASCCGSGRLLVGRLRTGQLRCGRDDALDHVAGTWRAAAALTTWLEEHVGPTTLAPRERWPRRPAPT